MPVGFVNSAAIILLRCAWQGHYETAYTPFRSSLANAHVTSCGWLGIHDAHLQAFGFGAVLGVEDVSVLALVENTLKLVFVLRPVGVLDCPSRVPPKRHSDPIGPLCLHFQKLLTSWYT